MVGLTPGELRQHIEDKWHQIGRLQNIGPKQGLEEGYVLEYAYALTLMYVSLLGFAYVCRALARIFFHAPSLIPAFAPVVILGGLPIFASQTVYDFPNLLLFSLCLLLMYCRRWAWFYPAFVAACFSKETSILLVAIGALYLVKSDRTSFWLHSSAQGVLWVSATVFIRLLFHENPGAIAEFHLLDPNLGVLSDPARYMFFDSLLLPRGLNVGLWTLTGALVFLDWQEKPLFLRRAMLLCPLLIATMLLWGVINELRALLEIWPIVAMLALPTIGKIFGVPIRATEGPAGARRCGPPQGSDTPGAPTDAASPVSLVGRLRRKRAVVARLPQDVQVQHELPDLLLELLDLFVLQGLLILGARAQGVLGPEQEPVPPLLHLGLPVFAGRRLSRRLALQDAQDQCGAALCRPALRRLGTVLHHRPPPAAIESRLLGALNSEGNSIGAGSSAITSRVDALYVPAVVHSG